MKKSVKQDIKKEPDYYITNGKKVWDFFIGFGGMLVINVILGLIFLLIAWISNNAYPPSNPLAVLSIFGGVFFNAISIAISLILSILGIIYFKKKGRRFISRGILVYLIATIVIPVLLFLILLGACFFGGGLY